MSKTKTETPVLRNSADIPWEETRLYLPADETEEENKALYERLKKEIADGHPVDEYNNEVLCRLTPLQQKEVGIPAFYIRPVVPRLKSSDENEARLSEMAHLEDELYKAEEEAGIPHQKQNFVVCALQKYADWKENRPRHKVDKRIYVLLTVFLGWCGAHRFLERRWKLGIFYLLVGWTGLGLAFALVDLLIALPIPKDENGMIEI